MKSKFAFKSKLTKKWFTSILTVITAILFLVILLCFYLIQGMKDSVLQMSYDMATYLQKSVDSRLSEVQKNAILFELNSVNSKIKKQTVQDTTIDSNTYQFCDLLQNFCVSSKLVDKAYIYYPQIDYVASNTGYFPADFYFTKVNPTAQKPLIDSISALSRTEVKPSESEKGKNISYIQNMRYDEKIVGVLVMEIDPTELFVDIQTFAPESVKAPSFAILLEDDYYLIAGDEVLFNSITPQKASERTAFSQNGIYVYQQPSFLEGIDYVIAFQNDTLFSPIYFSIVICSIGIIVCLVWGILYSSKISKKNTKPIIDLLGQLPENSSKKQSDIDELAFINQKVNEILDLNQFGEVKLQEQKEIISSLFLKYLITSNLQNQYTIFSIAQNYGIIWEHLYYQILLIKCDTLTLNGLSCLNQVFKNKEIEIIFCQKEALSIILLNASSPLDEWESSVFAGEILKDLSENSYCSFGLGYDNLVDINTSYQEALISMENCNMNSRFSFFKKSMRQNSVIRLNGIHSMSVFLNHLHSSRYKEALEMLPTVFEDYLNRSIEIDENQRRTIALQNAIFDEVDKQKINGFKFSNTIKKELENLSENGSSLEFQKYIFECLSQLTQEKSSTNGEDGSIPYRAKKMIEQNFTDPLLGLYMVADHLNISNTYLSTSFKNTYKVGVTKYINQLRINQAKDLILSTNLTIKEIATQVGFSSDISFIRVFKKYEKDTPNSLRKK